jgi:hypothetical protein
MAQAKIVIPPDTICVGCGKPKRDHGSVYKAACDRFRTRGLQPTAAIGRKEQVNGRT